MNWKQFDQQRWQFLRYARREFRRALSKQIAPVIQALKDKGTHDTEGALVLLMDDKPMEDAFIKVYRRVGGHFGKETFKQYAKSDNDTWTQNVLKHIMNNGHEKIKGIDENNIKKIRAVIADGTQKGLGIDEIGRNIRSSVGSMQRATLIARTEVIAASNLGSIEGAKATGLPMKKLWLSTPDERTRPEHVSVDPVQTVDGLFMVGSDKMEYPGDIANGASAGNTINCRCAIGYDPYGRTENEGAERFIGESDEIPEFGQDAKYTDAEIEKIITDLDDLGIDYSKWDEFESLSSFEMLPGKYGTVQNALAQTQGFRGLPTQVSDRAFRAASAKTSEYTLTYRGVGGKAANKNINQFKKGELFGSSDNMYGNGTYLAGKSQYRVALTFGDEVSDNVLPILIKRKGLKTIDLADLQEMRMRDNRLLIEKLKAKNMKKYGRSDIFSQDFEDKFPKIVNKLRMETTLYKDIGQYATIRGYDAYTVKVSSTFTVGGRTPFDMTDYIVLLNRTKAIVPKTLRGQI